MQANMKRLWRTVGTIASIGGVIIIGLIIAPKPLVPAEIKRAVTSTILIPVGNDVAVKRESMRYDAKIKLLTFSTTEAGANVVFSEQPTPDSFTDIPQVYDKVVINMNEYASFSSDVGTVHLTRPKDLQGKQAAVMNTKGTLMFAKPEHDLSEDQWRKLINGLVVVK